MYFFFVASQTQNPGVELLMEGEEGREIQRKAFIFFKLLIVARSLFMCYSTRQSRGKQLNCTQDNSFLSF